jgi:hypothetical protein
MVDTRSDLFVPAIVDAPIHALVCRQVLFAFDDITMPLSHTITNLLPEFKDVFSADIPLGLPPFRGIEHQIDLIPGAMLPNRVTYRTNPEETKEIQRQVHELFNHGYVRKSLSLCVIPVILVPKKNDTWHMCVDCRAINNITIC